MTKTRSSKTLLLLKVMQCQASSKKFTEHTKFEVIFHE